MGMAGFRRSLCTIGYRYPTLDECQQQARSFCEMSNEALLLMAAQGDLGACTERLHREVMAVDGVVWPVAAERVDAMAQALPGASRRGGVLAATSLVAGFGSLPMVFHYDVALWFNERFVTADVPEPKDLETWLEVGSWTWNCASSTPSNPST